MIKICLPLGTLELVTWFQKILGCNVIVVKFRLWQTKVYLGDVFDDRLRFELLVLRTLRPDELDLVNT